MEVYMKTLVNKVTGITTYEEIMLADANVSIA